ncbi:MAG: (4Fe-4S)-binding protein [Flavobacteriaceae bacterium]|nr:(4Fe-4S)-binding protein [Bacteroidia bacterium]NNF76102.1 (4Fe-4S)-binding protein [Flavobacteriaceae bacterium]NNK88945.1 (4Fe-4S)-binding protein [Flavobacteriaceae bacterium]NNL80015.1 (4Fe-4S)-binding protein [Flavobacteriaceae bacterium]
METYDNVFTNKEITVTYEPCACIHAEKCARELSEVFRTSVIPWINLDGSETTRIIEQINRCPSGALKFHYNKKEAV